MITAGAVGVRQMIRIDSKQTSIPMELAGALFNSFFLCQDMPKVLAVIEFAIDCESTRIVRHSLNRAVRLSLSQTRCNSHLCTRFQRSIMENIYAIVRKGSGYLNPPQM